MNENVIPVKTGIQKGLSLKIVLRFAQFRLSALTFELGREFADKISRDFLTLSFNLCM
jgi:hypothetical protein